MRKPALREAGILPKRGILRLYGRAKIHKSGAIYEEVWTRLIEPEKKAVKGRRSGWCSSILVRLWGISILPTRQP
jgi:hypothetical protein